MAYSFLLILDWIVGNIEKVVLNQLSLIIDLSHHVADDWYLICVDNATKIALQMRRLFFSINKKAL